MAISSGVLLSRSRLFSVLSLALLSSQAAHAQLYSPLDPIFYFCSRWFSSSIVKDGSLYINGGIETFYHSGVTSDTILGINTYLIQVSMETSWDWKTNITITDESKSTANPKTGTYPPSLVRGTMFHGPADLKEVYAFGGTTFMGNTSFLGYVAPDASTYPLWTYAYDSSDFRWDQNDIGQPWKPNHGAAAEAIDQGLGFYLNGQIDKGTDSSTKNFGNDSTLPLDGMLVIDLANSTSNNISTAAISGNEPRVGGGLQYIADVGKKGILVALGGQLSPQNVSASTSTNGRLLSLDTVDVFDISSYIDDPDTNGTWYNQTTTGEIPEPRIDFCVVAASAPDNSSHHIYLYGGHNTISGVPYDDIHVLSLPAFRWTKINFGASPRWGHDCHVVGNRQLLTVGGNTTNEQCDWEIKGVAILDMSTITWGSVYDAFAPEYLVPTPITKWLGGSPSGGATITAPAGGYNSTGLAQLMGVKRIWPTSAPPPSPSAPPPSHHKKTSVGVIVGPVIGGVAALALLGGLLLWLRHRRHKKAMTPHELEAAEKSEMHEEPKKMPYELPDDNRIPTEMAEQHGLAEAPRETTTYAVELPATTISRDAKPGVPMLRTPSNEDPPQLELLR
ncbi:uncharacterized protein BDZ99DRAFT_518310 [Mytilinidion resinicola]|uniref:Galactose oxidase n=1 Tax=Mytilinidion resinicola TaxID=574789 RepID=A0A6A6YVS1_9PEZI|nr:uncharacterized protein BDZ99DRAFT_518310 [Mytilinidion resinicola]KAF2812473.1 hypothetical protein BDZ99DRAFT_518310 [Mytilinidion resinicola]